MKRVQPGLQTLRLLLVPGEFATSQGVFFLWVKDGVAADAQLPGAKAAGVHDGHTALFFLGH